MGSSTDIIKCVSKTLNTEDPNDTTVLFDPRKGNQKRLIVISTLVKGQGLTQQYCTALLALHAAFTGCDTTSAFKGKGKIRPIKLVQGNSSFIETFASLGSPWKVPEHTFAQLEEFACLVHNRKHLKLSMTSDIACIKRSVVTKRSTQILTWNYQLYHLPG